MTDQKKKRKSSDERIRPNETKQTKCKERKKQNSKIAEEYKNQSQ